MFSMHFVCTLRKPPQLSLPVQPVQVAFQLHMIEVILAKCLIKHDCHRIAKIQGADIIDHRDTDRRLLILYQNFFRDPALSFRT